MRYLSETDGIGIGFVPSSSNFFVEEITKEGNVLTLDEKMEAVAPASAGAKFTHFILQKKDWSTLGAEMEIARRLHISPKRLSHAGVKDKNAMTVQLESAFAVEPEKVLSLHIKDMEINGAWLADEQVRMGDLQGNRFTVKIGGGEGTGEKVQEIYSELDGVFPNYFGTQRFGSMRENTHIVGKMMLKGDFEGAVGEYLCGTQNERDEKSVIARKNLLATGNYGQALREFPHHLKYERTMAAHLASLPHDFVGALQRIPRGLSLMFVHAYQSYLFNLMLEERVKRRDFTAMEGEHYCGKNEFGFADTEVKAVGREGKDSFLVCKLLGYETKEEELNEIEKEVLEREGIALENFRLKKFAALSSKGGERCALAPLVDFSFKEGVFSFSLQKGAYATVALGEFLESKV
ncbi:tRNA pseudouridine(13) synthase TruD [Candidatus Micrarchaeota archaeon CG1_02_47_40]|nr:MAG: tRNA pseudouridine(13) synthase TruD [Candidatus Micrarchaeota archaeon CG1_02_47_40]